MGDKVKLQEYRSKLSKSGYFNGAILVARNDEVLLSNAFGMANFTLEKLFQHFEISSADTLL
ncbi:hypothetical protein [Bacillus pseudomycoides]|uniref:hypothetical protein n=1 Tax=Bacillus pseudomycoides TaxID=64104 RepID=UPI000BEBF535|nr:hypothetical protein [Bacillus pseudomycoides]PED09230.1 hypothetical protein COO19_05840 [Bacillus pseudomycoides]PEI82417.1 hypothetical protein CN686_29145 [Bacillus pseudomycoides]PEK15807.1 hypothetical protein CN693_22180 [Bacillus pseudomycoides]PEM70309.1 hypothetical protein CN619_20275 [Bacillus pseudomycoides]PEO11791.1 hypothetical protein CN542_21410 [Bacillus pseudomycoides]